MSDDAPPMKVKAEHAIEYLREHPEAGLCWEAGRWWITPNVNDTDWQAMILDAAEADRVKDHSFPRPVQSTAHSDRALWVVRTMT